MNVVLLMMGGSGVRFGAALPKQFTPIREKPLFYWIMDRYAAMPDIGRVIVVANPEWLEYTEGWIKQSPYTAKLSLTGGGRNRSQSVRNGLKAAQAYCAPDDVVLIHDVTHPYVDEEGVRQVIAAVRECGGATMGGKQYDTCYQVDGQGMLEAVVPREYIVSGASPEAFRFGGISGIYFTAREEELEAMTSAGALALAHGIPMKVIPLSVPNLKITWPTDREVLNYLFDYLFPA